MKSPEPCDGPFGELDELKTRLDRLFDQFNGRTRAWTPAIDVVRDDGDLVLRAELPGIMPEEVKIEVEDDILTVSGEHQETKEEKDKKSCAASAATAPSHARSRCPLA